MPDSPAPEPTSEDSVRPVRPDESRWIVGQWSGLPNYECKECPFSTLDLPKIEEHIAKVHTEAEAEPARRRYKRRE
jgi:hypothetical protein